MPVTKISDVALEARVSAATVSRVLNGHTSVDPRLAERVRSAAERLSYRPNAAARGLRRRVTDLLALIIPDIGNPFFTAVARGVEDAARGGGYALLLCNADEDSDKEAVYLGVAEQQHVAGVILSPHRGGSDVSALRAAGVPLVVIDRPLDEPVDTVTVHSFEGARAATDHLLDAGWMRPACITGPADATTALERLRGYQAAVGDAGVLDRSTHAPFRQNGGARSAAALLDGPEPPDSFFVANAQMALGVLDELRRRDLRVGVDVGVITFDDAPWAPFMSPPMSVVTQPAYDVGAQAARLLLERVGGGAPEAPRHVTLSTTLVVRESSRRHHRLTPADTADGRGAVDTWRAGH